MDGFRGLKEKYEVVNAIGHGGSGVVLHAIRRSDQLTVAIKVVSKARLNQTTKRALALEVKILEEANCEQMVGFIEVLEDCKFVYIVMEHVAGGDLYRHMKRNKYSLGEQDALRIIEQVLEGLMYLHDRNIAHRDIKLENIMLTGDADALRVKLIDFGLAAYSSESISRQGCMEFCGTLQYCAPEVAAKRSYAADKLDMWGVGVVLYAMLCRKLPFQSSEKARIMDMIVHESVQFSDPEWDNVSDETRMLVSVLLSKRGTSRPSAATALKLVRQILRGDSAAHATLAEIIHNDRVQPVSPRGGSNNLFEIVLEALQLRWLPVNVATA
eukprot:Plantae.Rhodophyta-Purpureofilum_apyrenoidigerum.ctg12191.p1 GENE.Plantae.Rhodophyta-Purpureofilum_apyrenoidigerum.ctg12191~~Plantae.Rhodophyta-Purpureofilum_apyrenoidigerum.ctg12191.p1  ORF type:complete len:327 (-),score=68.09 Plantae.Rhodophyta-Purpureofilum_apyrenoidigerum.ctg12191:790-1770(-)